MTPSLLPSRLLVLTNSKPIFFTIKQANGRKQTASQIESGKYFGLVTILFGGNKMLPFF